MYPSHINYNDSILTKCVVLSSLFGSPHETDENGSHTDGLRYDSTSHHVLLRSRIASVQCTQTETKKTTGGNQSWKIENMFVIQPFPSDLSTTNLVEQLDSQLSFDAPSARTIREERENCQCHFAIPSIPTWSLLHRLHFRDVPYSMDDLNWQVHAPS